MSLLGDVVGFMNEPIPSFFFEVLVLENPIKKDAEGKINKLEMAKASAALAAQVLDPGATAFQQVSGLGITLETETFNEAGWSTPRNIFKNMKNDQVTLTRYLRPRHVGVMGFSADAFSGWCQDTVKAAKTWESQITPKDVMIFIYHPMIKNPLPVGPASFPVAGFLLQEAYPVEWSISELDSMNENEPIKETIALKFTELQRLAVPPA